MRCKVNKSRQIRKEFFRAGSLPYEHDHHDPVLKISKVQVNPNDGFPYYPVEICCPITIFCLYFKCNNSSIDFLPNNLIQ